VSLDFLDAPAFERFSSLTGSAPAAEHLDVVDEHPRGYPDRATA
jgi:hypothetical protein